MKRWLPLITVLLLVWPLGLAHARGGGGPRGPGVPGAAMRTARPGQCSGMQERLRLRDGSCQTERTREQQRSLEQDREQLRGQDQERTRQGGDL